ncbi:MAG TPA: hypothetical protein VFF40_01765 [Acidimicrobiia bacterium]|nr:hypothetical protein [Acidimicrobiia bacterium]
MIRKIALGAAATALTFGGLALVASPAGAGKPPPFDATGSVTCSIWGKAKIDPPLTNANVLPSTTTAKIKGKDTCSGTTGNPLVTPTTIKAVVTSTGTEAGTCDGLVTPGTSPFNVDIKWKAAGGKLNPSTIVFPGITPAGIGFDLNNGNTTGSYAGTANANAHAHANIDPAGLNFALCAPTVKPSGKIKAAKGIKKLVVTSGTISITS